MSEAFDDLPEPTPVSGRTGRASVSIAAWTIVSRATGLARIVVAGVVLGPTYFANTFLAANTVPTTVYTAVAGPVLALVLVPAIVGMTTTTATSATTTTATSAATASAADGDPAQSVARACGFVVANAGVVAALIVLAAPAIGWTLTFAIPDPADRSRALWMATILLVCVAPQVVLYALAGIGAAVQQARGRFALAAAAPAAENLGTVAVLLAVSVVYGTGPEVGGASIGLVVFLGTGATVAVGLHAALQMIGAARAGLPVRPARHWSADPVAREIAQRVRRSVIVALLPAAGFYLLYAAAATVAGGVLVLQLAYAVYTLVPALGSQAISTVALPGLTRSAASADRAGFAAAWRTALTYVAIASAPALCLILIYAAPIAEVLAAGRAATPELLAALVAGITVLGVSQTFYGLHWLGRQALFALPEINGPRIASVVAFTAVVVVVGAGLLFAGGAARLTVIAGAVLAADVGGAAVVLVRVRRAIGTETFVDRRAVAAVGVATAGMLPIALLGRYLADLAAGRLLHAVAAGVAGVAAAAVFVAVLRFDTVRAARPR